MIFFNDAMALPADQLTLSQPRGADYAQQIILVPADFKTFRRPWYVTMSRTTDTQIELFSKILNFSAWGTYCAKIFWGIWGIFSRIVGTHFGTVSSFSMFSIIQPSFLQKTKPLYPIPKFVFEFGPQKFEI